MAQIRQIQDLHYDGKKLFCHDHPEQQLTEVEPDEDGKFSVVCFAPLKSGGIAACPHSAQWETRADMRRELQKNELPSFIVKPRGRS